MTTEEKLEKWYRKNEKLHEGCENNVQGYCIKYNQEVKYINFRCKEV